MSDASDHLVQQLHTWIIDAAADQAGDAALRRHARTLAPLLSEAELSRVCTRVQQRTHGLGMLEPLFDCPEVTDIMVNGPGAVWVERGGVLERSSVVIDRPTLEHLVERIVAPLGRRIDRVSPFVDARLSDGSRVHAVVPPLAVDGPYLTIRRFSSAPIEVDAFASPGTAALLRWAVTTHHNVLVSGGTGAGKTTLLGSLARSIPAGERVITIEDAAELQLPSPHVVRLESRPATVDGPDQVSIRELVRNSLRMRPDRIVVGEVRGPEALDMLQAMNTGHEGSLSTCHANGAADALRRLETMVLTGTVQLPVQAIRSQIHSAIDLVVHLQRSAGRRRVVAVAELGSIGTDGIDLQRLAGPHGLERLPSRRLRRAGHPPASPEWIEI